MNMPPTGLSTYVERGGEVVYSPPGIATGVHMDGWIVRADGGHLQQMLDRYLNKPSNGHVSFTPASDYVVFNFTHMDHIGASTPPDNRRGYFAEDEVAIWMLVRDEHTGTLSTFIPYMWVDNGMAQAMGREVYGFPKQLGRIKQHSKRAMYRLRTFGVETWGEDSQFEWRRHIRATANDVTRSDLDNLEPQFHSQAEFVDGLRSELHATRSPTHAGDPPGNAEQAARIAQLLSGEIVPTVFLKQFRDVHEPLNACFQAVDSAEFQVTGFRGAGILPGNWRIKIDQLANEPIRREFGFESGPLDPLLAFWVDFDFTLSTGITMWQAPQPPRIQIRAVTHE